MSITSIHQTKLYQAFLTKSPSSDDIVTVETACNIAEDLLTQIPHTFPTYTLHNVTHSQNVCNIIYDLLGEIGIQKLTIHETALLMLAAYYHDTGMVYSATDKAVLTKEPEFQMFLDNHKEAYIKVKENNGVVSDDLTEWYYRSIHHIRMVHLPQDIVINKVPISRALQSLCISHGENIVTYKENPLLQTIPSYTADLFFCAVLIRLADILDFDKSRAPEALYNLLNLKEADNTRFQQSKREYLKHKDALGFVFPDQRQNGWTLPFYAICHDIEIEHDIRDFLDIIEKELITCSALLNNHIGRWGQFPLPLSISRHGIQSVGYQYGHYLFTLEQDKAINLFIGENLYSDKDVFVRELMQNAIDSVRHRAADARLHNDPTYQPCVKVTTWHDANTHHHYIRIQDNGMGMNEHKIKEFFLKVGKSYYDSIEFQVDRIKYQERNIRFKPVSRFGIGILSCFIAGDKLDLTTNHALDNERVRLSIEKGKRYFKLQIKNKQEQSQIPDDMPTPPFEPPTSGFSNESGTTITIRINPYQHFAYLNFDEILKKYVVYPPVPVFFNGTAIPTEQDLMDDVNNATIVEKRIPKNVIEKVKKEWDIEIDPSSSFKIGLLNIDNLVTASNKDNITGAIMLLDLDIRYEDHFENNYSDYIKTSSRSIRIKINERNELELFSNRSTVNKNQDNLENQVSTELIHVIQELGLENDFDDLNNMDGILDAYYMPSLLNELPNTESVINLRNLWSILDESMDHEQKIKVYNLNNIGWYKKHLSGLNNTKNIITHNGIFVAHDIYSTTIDNRWGCLFGIRFLTLCHDDFRPELSLSRATISAIPLEMASEINLMTRKAIKHFCYQKSKKDFAMVDDDFLNITLRKEIIQTKAILALSNIYETNGWYEYFDELGVFNKGIGIIKDYISIDMSSGITSIIFLALLQKHRQLVLHVKGRYKDYISVKKGIISDNAIIDSFYPPLFFVESKSPKLVIGNRGYGFVLSHSILNLSHPDSQWLIAQTQTIYKNYPALFDALVNVVYYGLEDDFNEIWQKIKSLPLPPIGAPI